MRLFSRLKLLIALICFPKLNLCEIKKFDVIFIFLLTTKISLLKNKLKNILACHHNPILFLNKKKKIFDFLIISFEFTAKELFKAFSLSTAFLALQKLFFDFLPPFQNFCLLFIFTFFSFSNQYYLQIQFLYALLLRKIMPKHFFELRDATIKDFEIEFNNWDEERENWTKLNTPTKLEKLFFSIFRNIIWFKLYCDSNLIKFSVFYFFIVFALIFNKLMVLVPIYIIVYVYYAF